jgi:hypothetical protein
MDVLILTLFVSLMLVAAAVLFLVLRVRGGDFEQGDRLSLLPLEEDAGPRTESRDRTQAEPKPIDPDPHKP